MTERSGGVRQLSLGKFIMIVMLGVILIVMLGSMYLRSTESESF